MTDTAKHLVPEKGRFRRLFATVSAWLLAFDSTGFDYTLDRIEGLERELAQLKEQLRHGHEPGPGDGHDGGAVSFEH